MTKTSHVQDALIIMDNPGCQPAVVHLFTQGMRRVSYSVRALGLALLVMLPVAQAQVQPASFVNYEIAPVHAMDMSPNGGYLAAVNTPDMRIELYSLAGGSPEWNASIPVGLEPVSVRFRTNNELWVVNNLSDSVSIIDVAQRTVSATLLTRDDPQDVVFAGSPQRAFVSCGFPHLIQVFNPADLVAVPTEVALQGNNPRALAVSPDGGQVYVAFFHSGNRTTILSGGMSDPGSSIINFPPDVLRRTNGPYGGVNPPPNAGGGFIPAQNLAAGTPPKVSLIVRQDSQGAWRDDTGADWTQFVSGANADMSGRYPGWNLVDHDLGVVSVNTLQVGYVSDLMNLCMALDVNPVSGNVTVVGTEAHNELRFEPNISAKFIDVVAAFANPINLQATGRSDLNASLMAQFTGSQLPDHQRATAVGDPRSVKWKSDGSVAYIAGMGSNNIVSINSSGQRVGPVIAVQPGPVGLVLDEARGRLYVQNRFQGSISVIDINLGSLVDTVDYFDPTPTAIRIGRKHLYDTQHSSAVGQISCASCHVDGRMDRLSWDLGNPSGAKVSLATRNLNRNDSFTVPLGFPLGNQKLGTGILTDFHPMKGPMLTQTLQDIIGHEPLHWRGDRFGIEEFNGAFHELQGRASLLTTSEMAEFKAHLATMHFPPNPFRNIDNTLPTNLPLTGHFATGRFTLAAGAPLPAGNAVAGLAQYRNKDLGSRLDQQLFACVSCHVLPTGGSTDRRWVSNAWQPIARGPNNENHLLMMGVSDVPGPMQNTLKVAHLRNIYERVGFRMRPGSTSTHGFGHMHDGNVASIADFIGNPAFLFTSDQQIANMVALLLSWAGSDFREANGSLIANNGTIALEPPGVPSKDSHAGVGQQVTITHPSHSTTRINSLISAVDATSRLELICKTHGPAGSRGLLYRGSNSYQWDNIGQPNATLAEILGGTGNGHTATFTIVPSGTGYRLALDRDMDGYLDYQEILNCSDPNDPTSFGISPCTEVVGGFVVHNGWTGSGSAIDAVKTLHRATGTPTILGMNHLTNTATGLNGIGFDIAGLAIPGALSSADFTFQVSPQGAFNQGTNPPPHWTIAPAPSSIVVTQGSPDQVTISWTDNAIVNRWLRITVHATANTGLQHDEVFYVGHLLGETTGPEDGIYTVSFTDITQIRSQLSQVVASSHNLDIDKNGLVSFADITAMRSNISAQLTNITVP
ncbi:MAG: hypothetical protein KF752_04795 [Pirellulaceae bacterium]|nr:hypothetical protein [Pirellulaceae bacterium]